MNRKLTHIKKTLNKMEKEITKIKNKNDTNIKNESHNIGNYNINNRTLKSQKNYNIKKSPPIKNYFKLPDKEKIKLPIDEKMEKDNYYINKDINNFIDKKCLLMENNFGYKSKNIFFDYKVKTKQNTKTNIFYYDYYKDNNKSKITSNSSYHKNENSFKNLNVDEKEFIKEGINIQHNENYPRNNQSHYQLNNNYSSCINIKESFNYSKIRKNHQLKNSKMYNSTINLKSNLYKLKKNQKSKISEYENLNRNFLNSNKNYNIKNYCYKEKYQLLINILKNRSIEEINSKANLFEKFGIDGFNEFFNKNKLSNNDNKVRLNCLLKYKNFIECLNTKNEYYYKNQIENYKRLCGKLIHLTNKEDLENIKEKINCKLQKNQYNSNLLINIQNILNYLDLEND